MRPRTTTFAAAAVAVAAVAAIGVGTALAAGTGVLGGAGTGGAGHLATVLTPDRQPADVERPDPTETGEPPEPATTSRSVPRTPVESVTPSGTRHPTVGDDVPSTGRHQDDHGTTTTPGGGSDD